METHDKMIVNNLICETLHPENCVAKLYEILQKINPNAITESTHLYGCTFDIAWSRFGYWNNPDQEMLDLLIPCLIKMQKKRKCRIKFEMKQACFHITALQ